MLEWCTTRRTTHYSEMMKDTHDKKEDTRRRRAHATKTARSTTTAGYKTFTPPLYPLRREEQDPIGPDRHMKNVIKLKK